MDHIMRPLESRKLTNTRMALTVECTCEQWSASVIDGSVIDARIGARFEHAEHARLARRAA